MTTGPPLPDVSAARRVSAHDDLLTLFVNAARAVNMIVEVVSPDELAGSLATALSRTARQRPLRIIDEAGTIDRAALSAAFGEPIVWVNLDDGDDALFAADVGITGADAAIAETGSVICTSGPQRPRSLSLVPPIHVAIVPEAAILPDLLDWFSRDTPLSANVALITGPSKTADIEGILVQGVHGPGTVLVFVVRASGVSVFEPRRHEEHEGGEGIGMGENRND